MLCLPLYIGGGVFSPLSAYGVEAGWQVLTRRYSGRPTAAGALPGNPATPSAARDSKAGQPWSWLFCPGPQPLPDRVAPGTRATTGHGAARLRRRLPGFVFPVPV